MYKTPCILIFFVFAFVITFSQPKVFIGSGFKALESKSGFFVSVEPIFEFWQLSADFNLNLMLNSPEKLYSLDVVEKNLGEIFESVDFKLWDLNYGFLNHQMKIFESSLIPIESFFWGKTSTYSITHSNFFSLSLKDQREYFFFNSSVKYPVFSLDIRGSLKKKSEDLNIELAPYIPISSFEVIPILRFSSDSLNGMGGILGYSKNNFRAFMGYVFSTRDEFEGELGFSDVRSRSLLNFGIDAKHLGGYIGITAKSISTCGFINFENEKIKLYFEPSLIIMKNPEKVQITSALFSKLEFSIMKNWKLDMSFRISPESSMLNLGIKYKIYEESNEGGDTNEAIK